MTDDEAPPESDVDINYLTHLRQHAEQTHLHLQGLDLLSPLPPFYTESPTSYWTSTEKSAFFHALSIYSRLRPDLIAECVKTKNVVDICAYMDMLEDGARNAGSGIKRSEMGAALEVSEKWIAEEEEKAAGIIGRETYWEAEALRVARENEVKLNKAKVMPKARRGEGKSREERKRDRVEFRTWRKARKVAWAKDDIMRSMGAAHLKVIDNILREEEETLAAAATSRQNTVEPLHCPPGSAGGEVIGPVLRSKPMPRPGPSSIPESSSIPDNFSPASRRRLKKRLYMRRKRAEAKGDMLPIEPSVAAQRAKPGRKSKPRKKRKTEDGSEVAGDDDDQEDEELRHPHIGGKTRHYRIKSQLESNDMDAEGLHQNGLGLFHLSALSKLMKLADSFVSKAMIVC
jgi:hypothetical protein